MMALVKQIRVGGRSLYNLQVLKMISYVSVIIRLVYGLLLETIILITRMRFQLESCVIYISFFTHCTE